MTDTEILRWLIANHAISVSERNDYDDDWGWVGEHVALMNTGCGCCSDEIEGVPAGLLERLAEMGLTP